MEKLKKYIRKEYLPVKIYIDDLEKIVSVLEENSIKYSIETDLFKYDALSELINVATDKKTKKITINTSKPYMTIEFTKRWVNIHFREDDTITLGLFHKIDSIIRNSERLLSFFYNYYFIFAINLFVIPIVSTLKIIPEIAVVISYPLALIWTLRVLYIRLIKYSTIELIRKEHTTSFLKRKKDDLVLAIISGAIGAILGALATILIDRFAEQLLVTPTH